MESLPTATNKDFTFQFQKLVCLDYIIRNTGTCTCLLISSLLLNMLCGGLHCIEEGPTIISKVPRLSTSCMNLFVFSLVTKFIYFFRIFWYLPKWNHQYNIIIALFCIIATCLKMTVMPVVACSSEIRKFDTLCIVCL